MKISESTVLSWCISIAAASSCVAFAPHRTQWGTSTRTRPGTGTSTLSPNDGMVGLSSFLLGVEPQQRRQQEQRQHMWFKKRTAPSTRLYMSSSDDFSEAKYTEAAWAAIATLTRAADYYQASTVESFILLDVLLNPSKHKAGDAVQSAQRVVETALVQAGVDLKTLRSSLEMYLSKQPKVTGSGQQKTMARSLQRVLETARDSKAALGVSSTTFTKLGIGRGQNVSESSTYLSTTSQWKYTRDGNSFTTMYSHCSFCCLIFFFSC